MARVSSDQLAALKKAFTEDAMLPGQAAEAGVTYATAKWYYELRDDEIRRSLESKLSPELGGVSEACGQEADAKAKRRAGSKRSPSICLCSIPVRSQLLKITNCTSSQHRAISWLMMYIMCFDQARF